MNSINPSFTSNYTSYTINQSSSQRTEQTSTSSVSNDSFTPSSKSLDDDFAKADKLKQASATSKVGEKSTSDPITLTIISTNDMHGQYQLMPKVAGVIDALRERYPDAIVVDGGDSTYNPPFSEVNEFGPITDVLNEMKYDVITLGNHEFQYGKESTSKDFALKLDADVVSANVHDKSLKDNLDGVKPYVVKDVNGLRVAFVGLVKPKMHTKAHPNVGKDLVKESTIEAMQRLMPEIKKEADVVIALTHQGLGDDERMASHIKDISLVLAAHDHVSTSKPIVVGNYPSKTYIVENGSHCKMVGLSQLTIDPETNKVLDFKFKQYPVETYGVKPNQNVAKIINDYEPVDPHHR